jgi:hypothetical protein
MKIVRKQVAKPMSTKAHLRSRIASGTPTTPNKEPIDTAQPPTSTDTRDTGSRPWWWDKLYSRDAKGIPSTTFAGLMDLADTTEVRQSITAAEGGKSPGHDGCSIIDLFKIIIDENLLQGEGLSEHRGACN